MPMKTRNFERRTIQVDVVFDPGRTDGEALANAVDRVLEASAHLFEEYGPVSFSPTRLVSREAYVDLEGNVRYRGEG